MRNGQVRYRRLGTYRCLTCLRWGGFFWTVAHMHPRRPRVLAGFGLTLAAAALAGWALVLMFTGYHGVGLVWSGLGAMVLLGAGNSVADGGHGGR